MAKGKHKPGYKACMRSELKGKRHHSRSAARAAFKKAAHKCS